MKVFTVEEKSGESSVNFVDAAFLNNIKWMEHLLHSGKKTKHIKSHMRDVSSLAGGEGNLDKVCPTGSILPIANSFYPCIIFLKFCLDFWLADVIFLKSANGTCKLNNHGMSLNLLLPVKPGLEIIKLCWEYRQGGC